MFLMTAHLRVLAARGDTLVHLDYTENPEVPFIDVPVGDSDRTICSGPLAGFELAHWGWGVALRKNGVYACAEPHREELQVDRTAVYLWEIFAPVSEDGARALVGRFRSPETELDRFRQRVAELTAQGKPVKIQLGCGPNPQPGFLNLDVDLMAPSFAVRYPDEYFLFRYADTPWGIPDNSVDYIFHEDFIEHISQIQQIQILAEALRVLKPGGYHRVNTPDLVAAMKRHSDFARGLAGVYTGELHWGHIAMFSPMSLKEMAEMVGYRAVVFTTRNCGVSPHAVPDIRPLDDRDPITGNIYADLLK